ncbi:MAG: acyl-ACP--UDP-N-acetylglucosamine O-acyltransferase [Planctomycetota bacterium]|nr:MAG: acyl-ACP--UDP-N-acetylglucosamine O-acyltransferase [Planctomycetota bacterium]
MVLHSNQSLSFHPTAIVGKEAQIGKNVQIGPYAIIEDGAVIGDGTEIMAHTFISRYARIGQNCRIFMGSIIGTDPQDIKFDPSLESYVEIGDHNVLREYVTVHRASIEGQSTLIGDHNFVMAQSHFGHDCKVGNYNIIANNALIAGHVEIGDHVFISGGVPIHQFVRVGSYAMLSGWSAVSLDVPPFMIAMGPNTVRALNVVGLTRNGIPKETIAQLRKAYKILYRSNFSIPEALENLEHLEDPSGHVQYLVDFIRSSKRGVCRGNHEG